MVSTSSRSTRRGDRRQHKHSRPRPQSSKKIYHFPIQRFECEGDPYYAVRQTSTDVKMFPSIDSLVKHYHTFAHVDPESDTFGLPPN